MRKLLKRRRPADFLLDAVFAVWAVSILVTGNVLPSVITSIFRESQPIVAALEPAPEPEAMPSSALPET
jgi:hypothetical protein